MPATELPDIVITPGAGGCAHFSLTAASSSSTPILFGCFRKLSSVAHFHFCYTRGLSSDGCWWHSKFQPSGSPRVFTGYVMTHALPGLGSHRCSNSWAHIIRGISQVLFGQEGLLLSFPTWQNNLGGMGEAAGEGGRREFLVLGGLWSDLSYSGDQAAWKAKQWWWWWNYNNDINNMF